MMKPKAFISAIGIKDDHRALPYEPWSKGQIERFFSTVCSQFTKWFTSYTGTLTGSKTFAKVNKNIKGMLERGELMNLDEFYQAWSKWLHEVYMVRKHGGLKKAGEEWLTPLSCFENAERYEKAVPPRSYATMLMMKSENRFVKNIGIQLMGKEYRSDELCDFIGQKVDIKYDPEDMGTIYVFQKGRKVCEAYCQELLQIAPKVPQKALNDHLKMQKSQQKRDRGRLEEARIPFEEMCEQYVGFSETTGGIDLMKGGRQKKAKIVQLPGDRTFQNGFRPSRQEEPEEENEYINKKAEDALKSLRAL